MMLQYFIRCRIVEPVVHINVRKYTYMMIYLQSAKEGVVGLTMLNPPPRL